MLSIPFPIVDFDPRVYHCKKRVKPFVLDGNIDKDFWQDAEFTDLFVDIEGDTMPKPLENTRAKMMWDDENLYIAAELMGQEIWAYQTEKDSVIFLDNDFEIFIDPDSDTHNYAEFEMNARNTMWDLLLTKPYRKGGKAINSFDIKGIKTAVFINGELNNPVNKNTKWSCEVVIPFETMKEISDKTPTTGDFWRINFSRVQWKADVVDGEYKKRINPETNRPFPEFNWIWSAMGVIDMHYPELWGFLFFCDNDEKYTIPEDEKLKWELRKISYKLSEYRDNNDCYPDTICDIVKELDIKLDVCYYKTKNSYELICKNFDCSKEISLMGDGLVTIK